jgi:hypothetical protein
MKIIAKCGGILLRGKYGKVFGEEPVSVSTFPPKIPGGMPWNRTRTSASIIRRYEIPDV